MDQEKEEKNESENDSSADESKNGDNKGGDGNNSSSDSDSENSGSASSSSSSSGSSHGSKSNKSTNNVGQESNNTSKNTNTTKDSSSSSDDDNDDAEKNDTNNHHNNEDQQTNNTTINHDDDAAATPANNNKSKDDTNSNDDNSNDDEKSDVDTDDSEASVKNIRQQRNDIDYNSGKSSYDEEDIPKNNQRAKKQNLRHRNNVQLQSSSRGSGSSGVGGSKKKEYRNNWNSGTSEEEEDEDESASASEKNSDDSDEVRKPVRKAPARTRPPQKTQKKKKKSKYTSDEYSDSDEEKKRSASRRVASTSKKSYKEASEDEPTDSEDLVEMDYEETPVVEETDKSETIERIVGKRIGKKGITGNQTTIYEVEENGDNNAGVDENDKVNTETQYCIKWKGWSHIHNTWESENTLVEQKVKGMKKLENYMKRDNDIEVWQRHAGPEDIDYYECQQELHTELLKSYNFVERIIAQVVKVDNSIDYFCKWESLPYAEATWEDSSLVSRKWPTKITEFQNRENSKFTPSKHCKALKYRPKFHQIKKQPEFLDIENRGLLLRDYQMDGLNWLVLTWCKDNSVILADEMGLGKTIQTICYLYTLFQHHSMYGPYLIVVPLSTMTAWQREFALWAPEMNVVTYLGDVQSREIIRQYEWTFESSKKLKFNAILTTYEILLKDKAFLGCLSWASLLVDEAHRLKNDDSLLYKALKEFDTNHRLLITGTPLQNSLKELWALLHFIMPSKFESWEEFEKEHGDAADKGYTKLHKQLEPYILRRVKKDVEKSLPAKVEQILRVEMTSVQKQYYKWILTKNFNALRKGCKGSTSTFLNIVIELKKCCNHAMLIRPNEYEAQMNTEDAVQHLLRGSGKLVLLDKLLVRLRETGHRVLIFSQMVRMLDIIAEYLQKRHFSFQRLDGSIKGEIRKQALDHFNAEGSTDFCFLLSTRAGGLGINLATADTVIIFDSDWNPQNDLQAQARAHRIGQKNQVNIYRLVTARSVEEDIVEKAKQKMVLDHLVIQRMDTTGRTVLDKTGNTNTTPFNKEDLSAILKFGAEELFKDEPEGDGDDLVCDIDEILMRAETRDEAPTMVGDELLSAFKVASFAKFEEDTNDRGTNANGDQDMDGDTKDWDEIIPENLRKAVEDEEKSKEMEDLYLPPRRKTLQQINRANDEDSKGRKRKQIDDEDVESEEEESDGSGDDRPRKRGRQTKEKFCSFTDVELRRFIKSYKKFCAPLKRLEAIACDAELQEKPLAELKSVAELLKVRCMTFLDEHTKENENDASATIKKRGVRAGFSLKFGGVSLNAKTLMSSQEELEPLDQIIPNTIEERLGWTLDIKTRPPANFDIDWNVDDDTKLLVGIYQYGIGSWDAMKMDPSLNLSDKILPSDENKKPQAKQLQSRAEYLLRIIKKSVELKKNPKQKKQRKTREKQISKETVENDDLSSGEDKNSKKPIKKDNKNNVDTTNNDKVSNHDENSVVKELPATNKKAKKIKEPKKPKSKKKAEGPMHFTANNEPRALMVLGDLDPSVFNECKEKMRPVKKALKALDNPDQTLAAQEQVNHTRACLLSIGKQIDICLTVYKEPDKIKEWKSNLWYFVSKFTEFDAKKLFKLYKHALKRSEDQHQKSSADHNTKDKSSDHHKNSNKETKSQQAVSAKTKAKTTTKVVKVGKKIATTAGVVVKTSKDKDKKEKEKKVRKEKKKNNNHSEADPMNRTSEISDDVNKGDVLKRRLEDGEYDESIEMKKMHRENRSRDRDNSDDRKKWNDYNHSGSGERVRTNSGGTVSGGPPRGAAPTTPQRLPPLYTDPRDSRTPGGGSAGGGGSYGDPAVDRWSNRDRFADHRKDRYETYNRIPPPAYHRERDHRDRDRDRRPEKRSRYPPNVGYPPKGHYLPPSNSSYFSSSGEVHSSGYRDRYPPQGGPVETAWPRGTGGTGSGAAGETGDSRDYNDYRNRDRRQPPPPANS